MTVFWDVVPCSLVEVYRRLRGPAASIIRAMALMMKAVSTAWRHIPEDKSSSYSPPTEPEMSSINLYPRLYQEIYDIFYFCFTCMISFFPTFVFAFKFLRQISPSSQVARAYENFSRPTRKPNFIYRMFRKSEMGINRLLLCPFVLI
jgi:hypothetical protein